MSLLPSVDVMKHEYGDWDSPSTWAPIDTSKQEVYMDGTSFDEDQHE